MTLHIKPQQKSPTNSKPERRRRYRLTGYHCGDFIGMCVAALFTQARYRVENPLGSTCIQVTKSTFDMDSQSLNVRTISRASPNRSSYLNRFRPQKRANLKGYSFAYRTTCRMRCTDPILENPER